MIVFTQKQSAGCRRWKVNVIGPLVVIAHCPKRRVTTEVNNPPLLILHMSTKS